MHQVYVEEGERSVLTSVTLMKGITGYKLNVNYWHHVLCVRKGPTMWQLLERKISFLCLFVCLYIYFAIRISRFFSSYFFCYPHFFSIRFFLSAFSHPQISGPHLTDSHRKPQNVTWLRPCGHVCSLQFTFEPQEGLLEVSDLRQGFFATKNCTASLLKARTSFLYPFVMCLLNYWSRINELFLFFGR